jgi:acyl-CoA reductase-like NAD-dependent aldehyde dehydrogenase
MTSASWQYDGLFVDGAWAASEASGVIEVVDPATEGVIGSVPDVDAKAAGTAISA